MDRKEYLQLCQKVSTIKKGNFDARDDVPPELLVKHDNITYYPYAYELSYDNGQVKHKAILHDLKTNSITYARLDRVMRLECDDDGR